MMLVDLLSMEYSYLHIVTMFHPLKKILHLPHLINKCHIKYIKSLFASLLNLLSQKVMNILLIMIILLKFSQ